MTDLTPSGRLTKTAIDYFVSMGRKSFTDGKPRVPACNEYFASSEFFALPAKVQCAAMTAFLRGWDAENLAA